MLITTEVDFPLVDLDMTKVFKDYEPSQPKPIYDLFAIAVQSPEEEN